MPLLRRGGRRRTLRHPAQYVVAGFVAVSMVGGLVLMLRAASQDGAETSDEQVLVIGLGRFGGSVASELVGLGFEVLGIDDDAARAQDMADRLTHVVQADATNPDTLRQLGAAEFRIAVVGIGTDIEASVLATASLADLGVPDIWAKAVTEQHGRILERVGAHHVVFPEHEMGQRVAHLVGGRVIDWFQLDADFALVETEVPPELVGRSLAEVGLRARYGVTVVCVKPRGKPFTYATAETVLEPGDVLVVAGEIRSAEAFSQLSALPTALPVVGRVQRAPHRIVTPTAQTDDHRGRW